MRLRGQELIWTVGIAAVTVAYLSLVTRPQVWELSDLSRQIAAARGEQNQDHLEEQALDELTREIDRLSARAAQYSVMVPREEMLGTFLEELARITQDNQLRTEHIEPGKPVRSQQVVALPIALGVRGPFPAVFGMIRDIERMDRLTQVEMLQTSTTPESPGTTLAELRLKVFFQAM